MQCENLFCVYWSKDGCILNHVSLDVQGSCQEYIYITINDEYLEKAREMFLERYKNEDK